MDPKAPDTWWATCRQHQRQPEDDPHQPGGTQRERRDRDPDGGGWYETVAHTSQPLLTTTVSVDSNN